MVCWLTAGLLSAITPLGCSSSPLLGASGGAKATAEAGNAGSGGSGGAAPESIATLNVFDHLPQFGIYSETEPNYSPPSGVSMWSYGTVFLSQLSEQQQAQIGTVLALRVTYFAQCDPYDRLGAVFLILKQKGEAPQPSDFASA